MTPPSKDPFTTGKPSGFLRGEGSLLTLPPPLFLYTPPHLYSNNLVINICNLTIKELKRTIKNDKGISLIYKVFTNEFLKFRQKTGTDHLQNKKYCKQWSYGEMLKLTGK